MLEARSLIVDPDPTRRQQLASYLMKDRGIKLVGIFRSLDDLLHNQPLDSRQADVLILYADGAGVADIDFWTLVALALPKDLKILALTKGESQEVLKLLVAQSRVVRGVRSVSSPQGEIAKAVSAIANGRRSDDPALLAKMKLVLMNQMRRNGRISIGPLKVDINQQTFSLNGRSGQLSSLEASVLHYLARRRGIPVSAFELLETVWGTTPDHGGTLDQVKSCIWRIRQKIEPSPNNPRFLISQRGKGYTLVSSRDRRTT